MRVVEQLIDHLRNTGHLTEIQLDELRRMGLLKKDPDLVDVDGFRDASVMESEPEIDHLDAIGDQLLADAKKAGTGRRGGGAKRLAAADADTIAAVERALTQEADFRDILVRVASLVESGVDSANAPRLVGSADPARLEAALSLHRLWAEVFPHIVREPILSSLEHRQRGRFCRVMAAGGRSNKSVPRRLANDPGIRRAVEVIEAHRAVCGAFGRYAAAVDASRAVGELNLPANPMAYRVLLLLYNARSRRRACSEIPHLPADVGLPRIRSASRVEAELGWEIAARIDPVAVLPLMEWWTDRWVALPRAVAASRESYTIASRSYWGHWFPVPQSEPEWFGLAATDNGWARAHFIPHQDAEPGQLSGVMIIDGVEYSHTCLHRDCKPTKWFRRSDAPGAIVLSGPWGTGPGYNLDDLTYNFSRTWAAGLHDAPLLACPMEWERCGVL